MNDKGLDDIIKRYNIVDSAPLQKGWSRDEKHVLRGRDGTKYLLRISDATLYEAKRRQHELLGQVAKLDINCSRSLEFGALASGKCYLLLTYLEGVDAGEEIHKFPAAQAYELGLAAGSALQKLHTLPIASQTETWWESYQEKMARKIHNLQKCPYKIPLQSEILDFYRENAYLMHDRPQRFAHGDFHLGNMVLHNGAIGIIDFDKCSVGDPYDDLKPFPWNAMRSEFFASGLVDGYFDEAIPADFFRILKFYAAESLVSHLPWAVSLGEAEVRTALTVANLQMLWYGNFRREIPTWYKKPGRG